MFLLGNSGGDMATFRPVIIVIDYASDDPDIVAAISQIMLPRTALVHGD